MKPIVIAVAAAKGGVGKSVTAHAIGSFLSRQTRTLLWDNDPQGSLTSAVAGSIGKTAYDVLIHKAPLGEAIAAAVPAYGNKLFIVPASNLLVGLEASTATDLDRQHMIADAVNGLQGFEYVIIDCPSAQNILTTAALVAADIVLTPVSCQPAAYETLDQFKATIGLVRKRLNPGLRWLISATQFDQRQVLDREILQALQQRFDESLLEPPVRRRVSISERMGAQMPCDHQDYELLTHNLINSL